VKNRQPIASDEEHRVVKFRPRTLARPPGQRGELGRQAPAEDAREPNDLSRYERDREEPDDFRQSAQNPGLRADGTARLRADFRTAHLAFSDRDFQARILGESQRFGSNPVQPALPASIELGAALRYTGTRLRMADRAFWGAAPASPAVQEFISNISKV
jgi:hypothetical protein